MLNKSILLNLNIAKNDMSALLGLTITCMVLYVVCASALLFPALLFLLAALILYFVFFIRIANKVCFRSFFDEEGIMYMTLPIPAKEMVLSKVLAVGGCMALVQIILVTGSVAGAFAAGGNAQDFITTLVTDLPAMDGTPLKMALAFALMPLQTLAACLFSASFILAVFLKIGMKKKRLVPCWIIYWAGNALLNWGLEQAMAKIAGSSLYTFISFIVYFLLLCLLVRYCVKSLEENYNG